MVTDRFIFVHVPKTGGAFVRRTLRIVATKERLGRLHWMANFDTIGAGRAILERARFLPFDRIRDAVSGRIDVIEFHDSVHRLRSFPTNAHKPALTVIRHPLDHLVDMFEYHMHDARYWKKMPENVVRKYVPKAPSVEFPEFIRLNDEYRLGRLLQRLGVERNDMRMDAGYLTVLYVAHLFDDPVRALRSMDPAWFKSGRHEAHMTNLAIVHTENLAVELRRVLGELGVDPRYLAFLGGTRPRHRLNVSAHRAGRNWRDYYDDDLLAAVSAKEWPLFTMFPEYDVPRRLVG